MKEILMETKKKQCFRCYIAATIQFLGKWKYKEGKNTISNKYKSLDSANGTRVDLTAESHVPGYRRNEILCSLI